jgi:DNA-binding GntR family transcriptional regulator
VTQLSIKEVSDIFDVRRELSGVMIARLSVDEAARLAAAIDADIRALEASAQDPDGAAAYFETTFRLGHVLREACSNERLAEILGSLARQTLRYTQLGLATPARRRSRRAIGEPCKKPSSLTTLKLLPRRSRSLSKIRDARRSGNSKRVRPPPPRVRSA